MCTAPTSSLPGFKFLVSVLFDWGGLCSSARGTLGSWAPPLSQPVRHRVVVAYSASYQLQSAFLFQLHLWTHDSLGSLQLLMSKYHLSLFMTLINKWNQKQPEKATLKSGILDLDGSHLHLAHMGMSCAQHWLLLLWSVMASWLCKSLVAACEGTGCTRRVQVL